VDGGLATLFRPELDGRATIRPAAADPRRETAVRELHRRAAARAVRLLEEAFGPHAVRLYGLAERLERWIEEFPTEGAAARRARVLASLDHFASRRLLATTRPEEDVRVLARDAEGLEHSLARLLALTAGHCLLPRDWIPTASLRAATRASVRAAGGLEPIAVALEMHADPPGGAAWLARTTTAALEAVRTELARGTPALVTLYQGYLSPYRGRLAVVFAAHAVEDGTVVLDTWETTRGETLRLRFADGVGLDTLDGEPVLGLVEEPWSPVAIPGGPGSRALDALGLRNVLWSLQHRAARAWAHLRGRL